MATSKKYPAGALSKRHRRLAHKLAKTGLILQGTITERTFADPRGSNKCFGPYYQWTFKREGKTITLNLTKAQAKIFQTAIDNNRKLKQIIQEMRASSLQICSAATKGVTKRKPRKPS